MFHLITMEPIELKTWRVKNDWSQTQLASALGVTNQAVSMWERGIREIPSFLYLALEGLESKGDALKPKTKRRRLRESVNEFI
jgi:transcriptional regulator with XRE-family HTH domain